MLNQFDDRQTQTVSPKPFANRGKILSGMRGLLVTLLGMAPQCMAGSYVFANDSRPDIITYPQTYNPATGGVLELYVCIDSGSLYQAEMAIPTQNIINIYNELKPTTGNRWWDWSISVYDFESIALHEVGHCLGQGHVNIATESGLSGDDQNYTKSTRGANGEWDLNAGPDGVRGSSDDVRGDDVNLNWFRMSNNNPFTIAQTVDSSTYARSTASLPSGQSFAANGDRDVSELLVQPPTPAAADNTETVMQQGTFNNEIQRTLAPEDVATLRYAMSGRDESAGTGDDYTFKLFYGGVGGIDTPEGDATGCDINLNFDASYNGFAYCGVTGYLYDIEDDGTTDYAIIATADIYFDPDVVTWHFNSASPCSATMNLTQNVWSLVSLPCQVGISNGDTVADVFGDDLGTGNYNVTWIVFERNEASNSYTQLTLADTLEEGVGYWITTTQTGQSITVDGQYNSQVDISLTGAAAGRWNMMGHTFTGTTDWRDVTIIEESTGDIKTLDEADAGGIMSGIMYKWNGSSYTPYDGTTPGLEGTLDEGEAFWVKTFAAGYALRIPRP